MLLPGALFVLFLAGCWLYCLTEALLIPASEYHGMSKTVWVCVIVVTFAVGALAWLIATRRYRVPRLPRPVPGGGRPASERWTAADEALARHPAGRSRQGGRPGSGLPKGPDDDPEFLRALDQLIKRNAASAADAGVGVQPGDEYLYHEDVEHEAGEAE